jgi:hypothetical protein
VVTGQGDQRLRVATPIDDVRPRRGQRSRVRAAEVCFVDRDQLLGRSERQGPKHDRPYDAEHCGVCTDAETEGQDCGHAKGARLPQRAPCVVQVLPELLNRGPAPHVARRFLNEEHIAELAASGSGGLVGRLAAVNAILNGQLEVAAELLAQVIILPSSP